MSSTRNIGGLIAEPRSSDLTVGRQNFSDDSIVFLGEGFRGQERGPAGRATPQSESKGFASQ
jgi:hypothetical protein